MDFWIFGIFEMVTCARKLLTAPECKEKMEVGYIVPLYYWEDKSQVARGYGVSYGELMERQLGEVQEVVGGINEATKRLTRASASAWTSWMKSGIGLSCMHVLIRLGMLVVPVIVPRNMFLRFKQCFPQFGVTCL